VTITLSLSLSLWDFVILTPVAAAVALGRVRRVDMEIKRGKTSVLHFTPLAHCLCLLSLDEGS